MTTKEALDALRSMSNEKMMAHNKKFGAHNNQFGVKMGDIRALAKKVKTNHKLGIELWQTGNIDAQLLAILILKPKELSAKELETMAKGINYMQVSDWFASYILKGHPEKENLRDKWMNSKNTWVARLGWSMMAGKIARDAADIDISAILDRIENEMPKAAYETQWTMNTALAQTGINHPQYRKRAIDMGEKMGIFRDYPTSKGCTSPFAPIWINEIVNRQK